MKAGTTPPRGPGWLRLAAVVHLAAALAHGVDTDAPGQWVAGVTEPALDAILGSPSGGIVAKVNVREGDRVKEGQVLVEFRRELEETEVERQRIVVEVAKRDLDRTRELFERTKSISREELDKREAEHAIAEAQLRLAVEAVRRKQVAAPFAGEIIDLFSLEAGEARQEREPVARLVDASRCILVCYPKAGDKHDLKPGQPCRVRVGDGSTGPDIAATVDFVSAVADPASGLFRVKVAFPNPGGLKPGVTAALWVGGEKR